MVKFNKFGNWVCKHSKVIIIISLLLLIPSVIGIKATRINYDILSYLPSNIETVDGQNILSEDFGMGSFSVLIVDDEMPTKDIIKLEEKIRSIDCVNTVIGATDIMGTNMPMEMLPDDVKDIIDKEGTTPILVTFKTGIAEDDTLKAIEDIKELAKTQCRVSGISATEDDIKNLLNSEMTIYVK